MDRLELIQVRSFGDKFNELTSLVYDHFGQVIRSYRWGLLGVGAVLAAIVCYFPSDTDALTCCMTMAFMCVAVVPMIVLVAGVGEKDYRKVIFPCLSLLVLPGLLFCLLSGLLLSTGLNFESKYLFFFTLFGIILLLMLLVVSLAQLINVSVLEDRTGFDAIHRVGQILMCRPLHWMIFLFFVALIALFLPMISLIPFIIVETLEESFVKELEFPDHEAWWYPIGQFVTTMFSCLVFQLYLLLFSLATLLEYGNAVERLDNVHFMKKFNNFDNL